MQPLAESTTPFDCAGGAGGVEDDRGVRALAGRDLARRASADTAGVLRAPRGRRRSRRRSVQVGCGRSRAARAARRRRSARASAAAPTPTGSCRPAPGPRPRRTARRHGPSTIGKLVGDRVGIDRHRDRAEHLRGHHRPVELRPVGADDGDGVAALEPEAVQARPHRRAPASQHLRPGPGLPDAEILVPHRRPVAERACVAQQEFWKGVRRRARVARHRFLPLAAWGVPRGAVVPLSRRFPLRRVSLE